MNDITEPPGGSLGIKVRQATHADGPALIEIDVRTWSTDNAVSPPPNPDLPFFQVTSPPEQFLVAEVPPRRGWTGQVGRPVGFVRIVQPVPLPVNDHVRQIQGLAVHPDRQRQGIGRILIEAACEAARAQGARRMTLRVLSPNVSAMRLYESAGFAVEGVLPEEFLIDGRYVDDVLMGRRL